MASKIIHQIWLNLGAGPNIPEKYKSYQESWIKNHPDWKYILWTDKSANKFLSNNFPEYIKSYNSVKYPIMKVDILRYFILKKLGGLYVDIDFFSINSLEDYLNKFPDINIFFVNTPEPVIKFPFYKTRVSNSLIYSKNISDPFWDLVISELFFRIKNLKFINQIQYVLKSTGPILLNDILKKLSESEINNIYKIGYLPDNQFNFCDWCGNYKPSYIEKLYSYHDYASTWTSNFWAFLRWNFMCKPINILVVIIFIIIFIILLKK